MNIEKMPLADLKDLAARVAKQMPLTQARERDKVRDEIAKLAASKGYTVKELIGEPSKHPTAGRKVPYKYRDKLTGVPWTGRGRTPRNFDKARAETLAA